MSFVHLGLDWGIGGGQAVNIVKSFFDELGVAKWNNLRVNKELCGSIKISESFRRTIGDQS